MRLVHNSPHTKLQQSPDDSSNTDSPDAAVSAMRPVTGNAHFILHHFLKPHMTHPAMTHQMQQSAR